MSAGHSAHVPDTCDLCGGTVEATNEPASCTCTCECNRTCDECWDCDGTGCACNFEPSAAQSTWIEPMRAELLEHPARVADCPGCQLFGLCALHDTPPEIETP